MLTRFFDLTQFISTHAGADKVDLTKAADARARCRTFLRSLRLEGLNDYKAAGCEIQACTIGPGDALYVPAGWMFHELVGMGLDVFGIKVPVVVDDAATIEFFRKVAEDRFVTTVGAAIVFPSLSFSYTVFLTARSMAGCQDVVVSRTALMYTVPHGPLWPIHRK